MGQNQEISSTVRYAITQWPTKAPRGAVTEFCQRHGISRKSFYAIRSRAAKEGPVAAWKPRSRRPHRSPATTSAEVIEQALNVRRDLEAEGWDYGPISVMDKMIELGLTAPSRATLARIFLAAGAVEPEPRKRPRAASRRFVYPAPNAMWQLDGFEYPLAYGDQATILQVIDDHSRKILASRAAPSENSTDVLAVVRTAISRHGVPQRFLTDNGLALNPTRRKVRGQLVDYLHGLGVNAIASRPGRPTTAGKSERHHQTAAKWLDKQELAVGLPALQELLDEFEERYNTERPNQALQGRITPERAWQATAKAPEPEPPEVSLPEPPPLRNATGTATRQVTAAGNVQVIGTQFQVGKHRAGQTVHIVWDVKTVECFEDTGESIQTYPRPAPRTRYVGNGKPRGFLATQPNRHRSPETPTVTEVLRHQLSPKS
ncbi:DDE-type integrase/transposase/recombinase [Georgenia sp. Z1491]|uniref:DDE-type integrase/transposase/recombinase n=1 Tax=Georgenia sp. Z1491 TaxID=3416707 RepID=UPI003CEB8575